MFQANRESCRVMSHDHFHRHHDGSTQLFSCPPPPPSSAFNGSESGPLSCNRNNRVACFGDTCSVVGAADTDAVASGSKLASFNLDLSGEMRSSPVNARVPPTASQWRELERQTIIYKYIVASEPVPPELLVPITKTQSNTSPSHPHELVISSCSNLDPEPWRCKRTDGKKWRCSRDVAPHQKYCERHSHKSRSRSRKPVELNTDSMANAITNSHSLTRKSHLPTSHFSVFPNVMVSAPNSFDHPRSLEWLLRAAVPSNSNQEWQHLKSERIEGGSEILYHHKEGQLDSNLYVNSRVSSHPLQAHHRLNDNCCMLLSPKSTSLDPAGQPQAQETRHSLDIWSSAMRESNTSDGIGNDHRSVSSSDKMLPLSTLTLSMSGGSNTNEENANGQASCSFGMMGSDKMNHGSWMSSPPGGPLAEALCLGISNSTRADSKLASSHGDSCGTNSDS